MASLIKKKNSWQVQIVLNKRRHTIHIGQMSHRDAALASANIGHLVDVRKHNLEPRPQVLVWLKGISATVYAKLVGFGLVAAKVDNTLSLPDAFTAYMAKRTDWKPATRETFRQARLTVKEFFGDRAIASINRGDAADYRRFLLGKYSGPSAAGHIKKVRQVMADAISRDLITHDPFKSIKAGSFRNANRQAYVLRSEIQAVIDYCTDNEWKLAFALARFAGTRVPSELRALRWDGILWDQNKMVVHSPKTAHHPGGDKRIIPIFPEVLPHLRNAFDAAEDGAVYVFRRLRGENLATTGRKLVTAAGVRSWPKFWNNLRASCETDLAASYPVHVACAWIGNSASIAMSHYFIVKEEDYQTAAKGAAISVARGAQQESTPTEHSSEKPQKNQQNATFDRPLQEPEEPHKSLEILENQAGVLHFALQGVKRWARQTDRQGLARLSSSVDAAKRRAGGGR